MDAEEQLGLPVSHTIKIKVSSQSNGPTSSHQLPEMADKLSPDVKVHSQSFQTGHKLADLIDAVDALQADASAFLSAHVVKKPERS